MKAKNLSYKDLMIGDWVSYHGIVNKVAPADFDFHNKKWIDEIEPIPITTEILEKNGLELKPDGWLWCKEKGIDDKNYIFIQFRKGCDEVRLVELNFVNKVLAKNEQIHYVHELQHALRLCGIEKDIQL